MNEAERIWRDKTDDDLLDAAAELDQFTEAGREVIRAELKRRGLEDPVEQAKEANLLGVVAGDEPVEERDEDGTVPAEEGAAAGPACLRCEVTLRFVGTKKFHEGTPWGAIGEIGHLFEKNEAFDVYVCPSCGHVDLFVDGVGEDPQPE